MNIENYTTLLNDSTNSLLSLVKSCDERQLHYSEDGKWSIIQILEHLCITENRIAKLLLRPSESISDKEELIGEESMNKMIAQTRNDKRPAPEPLHPKGEITSVAAFEKVFITQRNQLINDLVSGTISIDNRIHKHPFLGELTIVDWLYFILSHGKRHEGQISEILQSAS